MSAGLPMQGGLNAASLALGQEATNHGDLGGGGGVPTPGSPILSRRRRASSNLLPLVSSLLAWAEWMSGLDKPAALERAAASARTVSESMPNSAWSYAPYLIQALILNQTGDGLGAEQWIRRAIAVTGYDLDA